MSCACLSLCKIAVVIPLRRTPSNVRLWAVCVCVCLSLVCSQCCLCVVCVFSSVRWCSSSDLFLLYSAGLFARIRHHHFYRFSIFLFFASPLLPCFFFTLPCCLRIFALAVCVKPIFSILSPPPGFPAHTRDRTQDLVFTTRRTPPLDHSSGCPPKGSAIRPACF